MSTPAPTDPPPARAAALRALAAGLVLVLLSCGSDTPPPDAPPSTEDPPPAVTTASGPVDADAAACVECHADVVSAWTGSKHALDSRVAGPEALTATFGTPDDVLSAARGALRLVMEEAEDGFRQTVSESTPDGEVVLRSEVIAIAIGATKGQTYLFWSGDLLHQMPASWLISPGAWVYSPSYEEGDASFEREVDPTCLACHANLHVASEAGRVRRTDVLELGIGCTRCHGAMGAHLADPENRGADPPVVSALGRDRQLDVCGQCHAGTGLGEPLRDPFAFEPGSTLSDFYAPVTSEPNGSESHANQVALLAASACFDATAEMTCTTCHDPHGQGVSGGNRNASCVGCHEALVAEHEAGATEDCVDCHMPIAPSSAITIERGGRLSPMGVRSHRIAVY